MKCRCFCQNACKIICVKERLNEWWITSNKWNYITLLRKPSSWPYSPEWELSVSRTLKGKKTKNKLVKSNFHVGFMSPWRGQTLFCLTSKLTTVYCKQGHGIEDGSERPDVLEFFIFHSRNKHNRIPWFPINKSKPNLIMTEPTTLQSFLSLEWSFSIKIDKGKGKTWERWNLKSYVFAS